MTRLMIFVVILIVMAVLALQNQETTVLTILGSQQTPEIPFGLLLVGAFGAGSLLTLFLYGLVGHQPPESKYRPMGRRVPYPDSPGSANLPPSGPPTDTVSSPYSTAGQSYGSSTAFVREPTSPRDSTPQDAAVPPQNSYSASDESPSASSADIRPNARPDADPYQRSGYSAGQSTGRKAFVSPVFPDTVASATPESVVDEPVPEKKKGKFNLLNRKTQQGPSVDKRVGDDWGELRTAEHLNSWDTDEVRRVSGAANPEGKRGVFDFIGIGASREEAAKGPQSADRLADDIAAGWDESGSGYSYDEGYEGGGYASAAYRDDLDSGWEEGYGQDAMANAGGEGQRRVYRDGIYADGDYADGDYSEGLFEESGYAEGPYDPLAEGPDADLEEGPEEGVYEAEYRVIVPPAKPLDEVPLEEAPLDESDRN